MKHLHTAEELLSSKYGKAGTESRDKFESEAQAYYYGIVLRERRKELKMTQQELAERVGAKRSYIARIEKGETDIRLSSFIRLISVMGLSLNVNIARQVV